MNKVKMLLTSSGVLAQYDPDLPMMAANASTYRISAVVSHVYPDGVEKLIVFASWTLTASESKMKLMYSEHKC